MATLIFVAGAIYYLLAIVLWFYIVFRQSKSVIQYQNDLDALKIELAEIQKELSERPLTYTEVKSLSAVICRLDKVIDNSSHT